MAISNSASRSGAMPDISNDIQDIYGYRTGDGGTIYVWRGELDDETWGTHLRVHAFHHISVEYFRFSVDGGMAFEQHQERLEKAREKREADAATAAPMPRVAKAMQARREKALAGVSADLLRQKHYPYLKRLAKQAGVKAVGTASELIQALLDAQGRGTDLAAAMRHVEGVFEPKEEQQHAIAE